MIKFICELGQNHNGSLKTAFEMVDQLKYSGAWAIKTAKRNVELHKEEWSKITNYRNGMNYYEHRKDLELTEEEFKQLKEYVEYNGFIFMSSFTDLDSLMWLQSIGVTHYKFASSRNIDKKLLWYVRDNINDFDQNNIFVSDGMTPDDRVSIMAQLNGWKCLMCTAAYPTDVYSIPAKGITEYDGFSAHWHTWNKHIDYALYGALRSSKEEVYIERHVTLNTTQAGIDHEISLECDKVQYYLNDIKEIDHCFQVPKQIFKDELPAIKKLRHDLS